MSVFYQNIDLSYTQGDEKCNISPKLVVYKDDYGLDIYFEIKMKAYRFQKDGGENILNSYNGAFVDTYLISPKGEEIVIKNNPVVEDSKLKFTITKDLTDEIEEVGKYIDIIGKLAKIDEFKKRIKIKEQYINIENILEIVVQ